MTYDCIVVGGGAAGLSAALVLGRARRTTLLVDAGRQSNLPAHGIGGLLGHDGRPPAELYAMGRAELAMYPSVEVRSGEVVGGRRDDEGFVLTLADGTSVAATRVLLAAGMDYRYPDVPGVAERWGDTVFHCPFCHGWEVREQPLVAVGDEHRADLLRMWSDDVTLVATDDLVAVEDGAVVLKSGERVPAAGVLIPVTLHQRSDLAPQLGAETAPPNPMKADAPVVDAFGETTVPGLFAAGDLAVHMPSVATAIASGSTTAGRIVGLMSAEKAAVLS